MHHSKLPLTTWFWAAYLMATHSNGISALQLQRQLDPRLLQDLRGCSGAKLRCSMVAPGRSALASLVEVDETEIACRSKYDPADRRAWRAQPSRQNVGRRGRRDRGRRRRTGAHPARQGARLLGRQPASLHCPKSRSGGDRQDRRMARLPRRPRRQPRSSCHQQDGRPCRAALGHRIFANLKVWALGVYHGLRRSHLQSYLDEFVFRFNRAPLARRSGALRPRTGRLRRRALPGLSSKPHAAPL